MKTWKLEPKNAAVAQFVQCYWFIEKESADTCYQQPRLNPDPCATLIIAPEEQHFRYQNGSAIFTGLGSHWILPNSQTMLLDHSKPFIILGIKFHVGALYSLNVEPKLPLLNAIFKVDLDAIINMNSFEQSDPLIMAKNNSEACATLMDKVLAPWLSSAIQDKHSDLINKAVSLLSTTPVSHIGKSLNCSQRTIERSFSRVTGFTLKQCQLMNRFEEILTRLHQLEEQDVNWLDIVDEFGFSDQPHLIRYIKNFIGKTPCEYVQQRDITIDVYGNFESS